MPASTMCYPASDASPPLVDIYKGVGGSYALRKGTGTKDFSPVDFSSSLLTEKAGGKKSGQPHKKVGKLTLRMSGAFKCLGSFGSKEYREDQAAISAIQKQCAQYKFQEGPSQRGYRKRQEALNSVIADAEGIEPCSQSRKNLNQKRDLLKRQFSTPILALGSESPSRPRGGLYFTKDPRCSEENKLMKKSHSVATFMANEPDNSPPKTSFLERYSEESRRTQHSRPRAVRFQRMDDVLPSRPAERMPIK